ncbi:hypothetical protein SEA_EUGENEKRABS_17 [Microbacterium phage EugeneKrabs]|nr:hypothetical protein SEA_EUGENEKRABS_17 [Microbacterium phage EugeneKrabs]
MSKSLREFLSERLGPAIDVDALVGSIEYRYNVTPKFTNDDASFENLPLNEQTLRWGDLSHDSTSIEPHRGERPVTDIEHANIVCSDIKDDWARRHNLILDIDFPVRVVESSHGKSHLYVDEPMTWDAVVAVMAVMVQVGLVQPGYMYASIERGYTSVRVPWALKGSGNHIPEPPKEEEQSKNLFDL